MGLESTIIDLSVETPIVLRPGEITPEELSEVLGEKVLINTGKVSDKDIPKAPGMKYRHYAPSEPVIVVDNPAIHERDYTGGEATQLYFRLLESGAHRVNNEWEAVRMIEGERS